MKQYKESIKAYKEGLDKFPKDELLKKGLAAVEKAAKAVIASASASNIKNKIKNEDFCVPKPPEPKSCRYIYRPEPSMETGSPLYFSDVDKRLAQIMKNNKKKDRNKECKTTKHIITALTQFKQVKEYICSHKCKERHGRGVILEDLICDDLFVECCVKIIQAMSKTDCRFGPCLQDIVMDWPIPVDYIHREKLLCNNQNNNNNRTWVVLLATTLTVGITTNRIPFHLVLRMIHELHSQATDQQQYNMDWSSFSSDTYLKLLNETVCRNALAGAGVKCSRHLYRMDKKDRAPLSSKDLLKEIEMFARDQIKYSLDNTGNGEFNLGWVAMQSASIHKNIHPLSAAADCLHWYTKAYTKADQHGGGTDDFVSGAARIEAAGAILMCGEGVLAIETPIHERAFVRRDFRTEFGEKEKVGPDNTCMVLPVLILDAVDQQHFQIVMKHEMDQHNNPKKPITTLIENKERHFIHWKKVLSLWNEAMKYYDRMTNIGFGYFLFGESALWNMVIEQVQGFVDRDRLPLHSEYCTPRIEPGMKVDKDLGLGVCSFCGKTNAMKKCSRCQRTFYWYVV